MIKDIEVTPKLLLQLGFIPHQYGNKYRKFAFPNKAFTWMIGWPETNTFPKKWRIYYYYDNLENFTVRHIENLQELNNIHIGLFDCPLINESNISIIKKLYNSKIYNKDIN